MATLWLASAVETKRVFYASLDNTSFYKLHKHEVDLLVILEQIEQEPTGNRRWRSRDTLALNGTIFSDAFAV